MSEMAKQTEQILLKIEKAEINIEGAYKRNKKAAALLAVMKRMQNLTTLVFNLLADDKETFDLFLSDLSKLDLNIGTIHIENYRPKSANCIKFARYFNKNIVKLELKNSKPACACDFINLATLTIKFDYFVNDNENDDYNDTKKLLVELPEADIQIDIFMNNVAAFVHFSGLLDIFANRQSVGFIMHYGVTAVVWGRQKMKRLTLENMKVVDKEIADKQQIVLKANHFYILMDFVENVERNGLDALLFDYLDIYVDDLRDANVLNYLNRFITDHKRMKRLDIAVTRLIGGLPVFWSQLSRDIHEIVQFSINDAIGGTPALDSIQKLVSDDKVTTLVANIQSCRYYQLPLDHPILLYLGKARTVDIEQKYVEWFKTSPFGSNYKVITDEHADI